MLKVIIADDEERVLKLINALIDWEKLQLELVGTASNGIEAIQLIKTRNPDILITDIRMPGLDGLELISAAKDIKPNLEMMIVSGHANFPYAQTAISYGVNDYLLKPINKNQLMISLEKICEKILDSRNAQMNLELLTKTEKTSKKIIKNNLIIDLLNHNNLDFEKGNLVQNYGLSPKGELIQIFCIRFDYEIDKIDSHTLNVIYERVYKIINNNLERLCEDVILNISNYSIIGVLNYKRDYELDVYRNMKDILNQLIIQKHMLNTIEFSIALNSPIKDSRDMEKSLKECLIISDERIIHGTGHLYDKYQKETQHNVDVLLEQYAKDVKTSTEIYDQDGAKQALLTFYNALQSLNNMRGFEFYNIIGAAATIFISQSKVKDQIALLEDFKRRTNLMGSTKCICDAFIALQTKVITKLINDNDIEMLRPIRIAKQYMQNHFQEPITLEQVSEIAGLNPSYFSVLFKRESDEGFAKYLMNLRIQKAKDLLRQTNLSISDICKEVGYNDVKHFGSIFQKSCGVKPTVYRKLYG